MENASKALIIAGAILLSILIIALGVFVFNKAKGAMDMSSIDELAKQAFNRPYEDYDGRVVGTQVKQLISNLIAGVDTNRKSEEKLPDLFVGGGHLDDTTDYAPGGRITSDPSNNGNVSAMQKLRRNIAETHYYYISFHYGVDTGFIDGIAIGYTEDDCDELSTKMDNELGGDSAGGGAQPDEP